MTEAPILVFPHSARALASSLVGHLHELSLRHRVVLLTEPLFPGYLEHLNDRNSFPGLETIRQEECLGFTVGELTAGNRRWLELARDVLDSSRPAVVVGENDMSSLFEMYLMREARRREIPRLTIQSMGQLRDGGFQQVAELQARYRGGTPSRLTGPLRLIRHRVRKNLGHLLVHYVLPWTAGEPALTGRSSYIRRRGVPGMRDSELHLVQSQEQLRVFLEAGVATERLGVLGHPLERLPADIVFPPDLVERADMSLGKRPRMLVLLGTLSVGVERGTGRLISAAERHEARLWVMEALVEELRGWEIIVKAHPDFGTTEMVRHYLAPVVDHLRILPPATQVELLLPNVDGVLDLPSPNTSTLVTATGVVPGPVLAVDTDHDIIGDQYSRWNRIDYVDSMEDLEGVFRAVRAGSYVRRVVDEGPEEGVPVFGDTNDAIRYLAERATAAASAVHYHPERQTDRE